MNNKYFNQVKVSDSQKRLIDKSLATGDEIIRLLEEKNMTQRQLAEALGKKESQVSKWLTGLHNFTFKTIAEIESVLGEEILLCLSEAQKRFGKAPMVLHNTVVSPAVFDKLRDVDTATLVKEFYKTPKQKLAPQLKEVEEFSFATELA